MRVCIVTSSFPRVPEESTNAGVFVADFAEKLAARGIAVAVVTPQRARPELFHRYAVRPFWWPGDEASLVNVNVRSVLNVLRLAVLLLNGIVATARAARRADHVLAMWGVPSGLLAMAACAVVRRTYSVWLLGSDVWKIADYPLGPGLLRLVLRRARYVYADGVGLAEAARRLTGVAPSFMATSRDMPPGYAAPLGTGEPAPFVTVARFHPHKGIDVLLDAIALIPAEERRAMRFRIFGGGGPGEKAIERQAAALPEVTLAGFAGREEVAEWLRAARALVVPSRNESIPLILSEAAQVGCPLIVTDVGDMGTLVREFEAGAIVPPEDRPALADALRTFAPDAVPRRNLEALAQHLSLDGSVDRFLADVRRTQR